MTHGSDEGSLHSIPDHLSPLSPLGSGSNSRAPSRQTNVNSSSLNSKSSSSRSPLSHASHNGGGGTLGSIGSSRSLLLGPGPGAASLQHTSSITEHGRRRPRREPGEPLSPSSSIYPGGNGQGKGDTPSPVGSQHFSGARLSAIGGYKSPPRTPASDQAFVSGATAAMPEGAGSIVGRT